MSALCKFFILCVFASLFPLVWVSIRLTLFCVFFFPSTFFVFRTPYSYRSRMFLCSISEAKWCSSCLNDEAASENLSDTLTVPKLVNSGTGRQEMPENKKIMILPSYSFLNLAWFQFYNRSRQGIGRVVTIIPLLFDKVVPFQKLFYILKQIGVPNK